MTLKDFLKVFDFEEYNIEIFSMVNFKEFYEGTYFSNDEVKRDFCALLHNVIEIRPVDDSTIQVVIS